ncbi:hypothetical protein N7457_008974 [Penicillium paradoxum]|uniref:uncharacterized protein n=1 Tax=Penicillium paradoxum TaxID=176176 RepID=UPI002546F2B6|nr:uncharacterized protein N7457_008974 [Penicillium paradoxum]KAJ5774078.1 hypothetical protein N7457_008974 [Penicillium paradoxum]
MPPKKGPRKSMPARINKAPTLTPSRRSPRVPPPSKSTNESIQPPKPLNLTPASPQDNSINIRFYTPNPPAPNPRLRASSPETPSSRRRVFQSRPSRLSTVFTPTVDPPVTTQSSRRTRRTAALETPKKDISDIDFPESADSTGWTIDQYMGSFESEGTVDGQSSPTSTSDMRNSSRIRKPTMRAIESFESTKKQVRRKNTTVSSPTVETPDPLTTKVATNKVVKTLTKKTRKSKRVSNLNLRKNAILIGFDIDVNMAGARLYDLTIEALGPHFTIPVNFPASWEEQRDEYFRRQDEEKYGVDPVVTKTTSPTDVDVDMVDQDLSTPAISPSPPTTPAVIPKGPSILNYEKQSDPKTNSDGWIQSGHVNTNGEEIVLIPEQYHPYYSAHTYGDETLPFPPVCARSGQQAEADSIHGFAPLMGQRNIPSDGLAPFVTENVEEEKARVQVRTPAPAPETKKPRVRKRRQTAAADAAAEPSAVTAVPETTEKGGRKSERRRRLTAPAPTLLPPTSPTSPPTTATPVQSSGPAAAVTTAATTKGKKKPKVQRLRLTLKPESKTETSGGETSIAKEAPAVQSPPSPDLSRAPSSAPTNKRRRRRGA